MVTFKKIKQTVTGKLLVEGECASADSKPIDIIANGSKLFEIDTGSWYFFNEGAQEWVKSVRGGSSITIDDLDVTENGTYTPEDEEHAFGTVHVSVPTYGEDDVGKVIVNGDDELILRSQGSDTFTDNGTYDTTLIGEAVIDVPNTYIDEEEGMIVHDGELVLYGFPYSEIYTGALDDIFTNNDVELWRFQDPSHGHIMMTITAPATFGGITVIRPLFYRGYKWYTEAIEYSGTTIASGAMARFNGDTLELESLVMTSGSSTTDLLSYAHQFSASVTLYYAGDPWPPVDEDEPEPEPEGE